MLIQHNPFHLTNLIETTCYVLIRNQFSQCEKFDLWDETITVVAHFKICENRVTRSALTMTALLRSLIVSCCVSLCRTSRLIFHVCSCSLTYSATVSW